MLKLKNPLILALDIDEKSKAEELISQLGPIVGAIKLGPRLTYRYGSHWVAELSGVCPIFIDNKYFDIPSTMVSAVKASFDSGASLVTVHALAGAKALAQLAELEAELNNIRPFRILAVTILTSMDMNNLPLNLQKWSIAEHVDSLAEQVVQSGLTGIVCSGEELSLLKKYDIYKVTPGVRLKSSSTDDQSRIVSPREAVLDGATAIVVGRPVLNAENPMEIINQILESLSGPNEKK